MWLRRTCSGCSGKECSRFRGVTRNQNTTVFSSGTVVGLERTGKTINISSEFGRESQREPIAEASVSSIRTLICEEDIFKGERMNVAQRSKLPGRLIELNQEQN